MPRAMRIKPLIRVPWLPGAIVPRAFAFASAVEVVHSRTQSQRIASIKTESAVVIMRRAPGTSMSATLLARCWPFRLFWFFVVTARVRRLFMTTDRRTRGS